MRDRKCQLTDPEWENVLKSTLLQRADLARDVVQNEKLEATAFVSGGNMSIVFRKSISGITQRLGEIVLTENQDLELDTVSWISIAVERYHVLGQQVLDLTAKYESAQQIIAKLNSQLEELVTAKKDHEDALLAKFRDLLNSKKSKIRDQQRLLAGARVDPKRAEAVQAARAIVKPRQPTASRPGKRKGKSSVNKKSNGLASSDDDDNSDDEEGFAPIPAKRAASSDAADNDAEDEDEDEEMEDAKKTSEESEDVTEDESDALPDRTKSQPSMSTRNVGEIQASAVDDAMHLDTASPPPTRELPFSKGSAAGGIEESGAAKAAAAAEPQTKKSQEAIQQQQQQEAEEESSDKTTDDDEL